MGREWRQESIQGLPRLRGAGSALDDVGDDFLVCGVAEAGALGELVADGGGHAAVDVVAI